MALVYTAIPKYLHFAHQYILQKVIELNHAPVTPYGITFWLLDTVEREKIREVNQQYIESADELWVFGVESGVEGDEWHELEGVYVTDGVLSEVEQAVEQGMPIHIYGVDVDSQQIRWVSAVE